MKTYALLGAAGYIAPRHITAIQQTGGKLLAACDPSDSVGILDSHCYHTQFFKAEDQLWEWLEKYPVDRLVVCTPNVQHMSHISYGLELGMDVICEKPLVLDPAHLGALHELQAKTNRRVYTIFQLRLHPLVQALARELQGSADQHSVEVVYHTPRGYWYQESWKGNPSESGGLLFNIGVHLFDLLLWLFGPCTSTGDWELSPESAKGELSCYWAEDVKWDLSISSVNKPKRLLVVDGQEYNLGLGFEALHSHCYAEINAGKGTGVTQAEPAIRLVDHLSRGEEPANG